MRSKVTSAADAVSLIQDGDTVCTSGFVGVGTPNELLLALEKRFVETGARATSRCYTQRDRATAKTADSISLRTRGC